MDIIEIKDKVLEMVLTSTVDTLIIDIKFINDLFERLIAFGYEPTENDIFLVGFSIIKIDSNVKTFCNISNIPTELYTTIIDLCVAEILATLTSSGKLDSDFESNELVKSVNIGDTSVTFDTKSSVSEQMNNLIDNLMVKAQRSVICYRKLRW